MSTHPAGWNPNVDRAHAVITVDRSTATDSAGDVGVLYKGLALVNTPAGKLIYATNFRFGAVDVFDSHFNLVNTFTDPTVPAGLNDEADGLFGTLVPNG